MKGASEKSLGEIEAERLRRGKTRVHASA